MILRCQCRWMRTECQRRFFIESHVKLEGCTCGLIELSGQVSELVSPPGALLSASPFRWQSRGVRYAGVLVVFTFSIVLLCSTSRKDQRPTRWQWIQLVSYSALCNVSAEADIELASLMNRWAKDKLSFSRPYPIFPVHFKSEYLPRLFISTLSDIVQLIQSLFWLFVD